MQMVLSVRGDKSRNKIVFVLKEDEDAQPPIFAILHLSPPDMIVCVLYVSSGSLY